MYHMICNVEKPWARPASNCPDATEFKPPRTISAMTEEVKRMRAMHALNKSFTSTDVSPNILCCRKEGHGQNTTQIKIHKSRGVLRKISMYATAIHLNILLFHVLQ